MATERQPQSARSTAGGSSVRRGLFYAGLWIIAGTLGTVIGCLFRPDPLAAFMSLQPVQLIISLVTAPLFAAAPRWTSRSRPTA